jgi:hypothetical protein
VYTKTALRVLLGGGGDQGEFAEKSVHLKPSKNSGRLVNPELDTMNQDSKTGVAALKIGGLISKRRRVLRW